MSDGFERKEIIKEAKRLETDREMLHRFATKLYKDIHFIKSVATCDKVFGTSICSNCKMYKNEKCNLQTIEEIAHELMWATK